MIGLRTQATVVWVGVVVIAFSCIVAAVAADGSAKETPGVVSQVETAVKNAATKIEQEVTGVVKKLEESETPKKVGNELKRSANVLGEKVEQAGKKLKDSFKSE